MALFSDKNNDIFLTSVPNIDFGCSLARPRHCAETRIKPSLNATFPYMK